MVVGAMCGLEGVEDPSAAAPLMRWAGGFMEALTTPDFGYVCGGWACHEARE